MTGDPVQAAIITAVAATLRQIADWGYLDNAGHPLRDELLELAGAVEREGAPADPDGPDCLLGMSCPMCQEVTCDAGCPLEPVRTAVMARHRLANAIVTAAADYRRDSHLPPDAPLTAAGPDDPGGWLAERLAPHHITVWTPDPTAQLHLVDADTGGPARPLKRDGSTVQVLLWAGELVAKRTEPIDLTGRT